MPGMDMAARPEAHDSSVCQHCQSHSSGHSCSSSHGCNSQIAAVKALAATFAVMPRQLALLQAALPSVQTRAIDPPLRPPPD